jgi:2-polyprenyl-6-methoxyphenol hydroxylase-like FAD-dependent oxidoreductase
MAVQNYDVVTIGGGIAAASLAKAMAEHGAAVLILEKEQRFKDRVRGEGVVPWGVAEACELGIFELLRAACGHDVPLVSDSRYTGCKRILISHDHCYGYASIRDVIRCDNEGGSR